MRDVFDSGDTRDAIEAARYGTLAGSPPVLVDMRALSGDPFRRSVRDALLSDLAAIAGRSGGHVLAVNDRAAAVVPPGGPGGRRIDLRPSVHRAAVRAAASASLPADAVHAARTGEGAAPAATLGAAADVPDALASPVTEAASLDPADADELAARIAAVGVPRFFAEFGRAQPIASWTSRRGAPEILGVEVRVAFERLASRLFPSAAVADGGNPASARLAAVLDAAVADFVSRFPPPFARHGDVSINVSASFLHDPLAERFAEEVSRAGSRPWLEVDAAGALGDPETLRRARRRLGERGARFLGDGMTPAVAADAESSGSCELFDGCKFPWDREETIIEDAAGFIRDRKDTRTPVIISRAGEAGAIETGNRLGVTMFQGFLVDCAVAHRIPRPSP